MAVLLLVEDDRFLSDTVKSYLEWQHHEIDRAFDGSEAMEKMRYGVYDLIILDWQLPGLSGIDVLKSYREGGGQAKIVMFTGRADPEQVARAAAAGASGFVAKPFKLEQLDETLAAMLSSERD